MGYTKKQYEEFYNSAEAIVIRDEYGQPQLQPASWEEIGSFEEYTVFRRFKRGTNKLPSSKNRSNDESHKGTNI